MNAISANSSVDSTKSGKSRKQALLSGYLGIHFLKGIFLTLLAAVLLAPLAVSACDEDVTCDKCANESEFSWNPNNQHTTARLNHFYSLDEQITAAYKENNFEKVKDLAKENLELAAVYRCNWNYGNAIHDTNRVLGFVSLKTGDIEGATGYLLKAGKSTGSPQLNTFGPELDLANELLKLGKGEAVKTYLKDIKSFWEMDNGKVDEWLAQIDKGEKPELDRFATHEPGLLQLVFVWLMLLWPFVLSIIFVLAKRSRIQKKILFFIVAVIAGYAVMFVVNLVLGDVVRWIFAGLGSLSDTTLIFLVTYFPMAIFFLAPLLVLFVLDRFLNRKPRLDQAAGD